MVNKKEYKKFAKIRQEVRKWVTNVKFRGLLSFVSLAYNNQIIAVSSYSPFNVAESIYKFAQHDP